jgi:hypothetical protein
LGDSRFGGGCRYLGRRSGLSAKIGKDGVK